MYNEYDISIPSGITKEQLNKAVNKLKEGTILSELGEYFIKSENMYDINALILMSIACLESGYGTSKLAANKYNLFGIDARDSLKGTNQYGKAFKSYEECIYYAANRIGNQYLKKDPNADWRYCGGSKDVWSVGQKWCSKNDWGDKVIDIASRLVDNIEVEEIDTNDYTDYKEKYFKEKEVTDKIREILKEE